MSDAAAILHIPHLRVENANAVSGPLSWGFPPPSAFTGFSHALERRLGDIGLGGVGILCHRFAPQVHQPPGRSVGVFRLARHPYIAGWKPFKDEAAAIVEEGRAHLEISLLIEVLDELDEDDRQDLGKRIQAALADMRLAGGSIRGPDQAVRVEEWPETRAAQRQAFRKLRYHLLPGFALVARSDLMERGDPSQPLTRFLDLLALHQDPETDPETGAVTWRAHRLESGWLIPLPLGYAALGPTHPPGEVARSRDPSVPFRFVETLYGIGEWRSPHRFTHLDQILWRHRADPEAGLYLCHNPYVPQSSEESPYGEDH